MTNQLVSLIIFLIFSSNILSQNPIQQKQVLLIGTFHFNNPGADLAQTDKFDIMSDISQKELNIIANKIKLFAPDKFFVEWDHNDSPTLDSLYNMYLDEIYLDYVLKKYPKSTFYKENEIFQLAFKSAKLLHHTKLYPIDVQTDFPFDSVMISIEIAQQTALKEKIFARIKEFESLSNEQRRTYTLTKLITELNTSQFREFDLGSYITLFNQAGKLSDFAGANLVASWYRRNLLMYSLVQKITESKDQKIVILLGASHIALFKHFVDLDENFKVVELEDVLK